MKRIPQAICEAVDEIEDRIRQLESNTIRLQRRTPQDDALHIAPARLCGHAMAAAPQGSGLEPTFVPGE
jgi:hypothetical protein